MSDPYCAGLTCFAPSLVPSFGPSRFHPYRGAARRPRQHRSHPVALEQVTLTDAGAPTL